MSTIAPGARVVIRDEEWLVQRVKHADRGQAVSVIGLSELVQNQQAVFLTDLDEVLVLKPEDTQLVRDSTPGHRRSRLYLDALLRRSPPTDSRLVVGHLGAVEQAPYQWVPAARALSQLRPRILMADGVGLGKTIQVGILLSELVRRGKGQRILVVALKSILPQFQAELWARYTLPLVRLDSIGIARVQSKIPTNQNPFHHFDKVIVSIDTLKKDARYRRYLEDCHWDAVVIDECQNVAVRGNQRSQRAKLAQMLARNADALILTSATPHDGSKKSFASLMRLLEPTAISDDSNYSGEDVAGLFVRRFQKDVRNQTNSQFYERQLDLLKVPASSIEEQVFSLIKGARFQTIGKSTATDALFREMVLKSWLSSPIACLATLQRRLAKVSHMPPSPAVEHDEQILTTLIEAVKRVSPAEQTKLARLFEVLDELGYGRKATKSKPREQVVVFTERRDTMNFLAQQIQARYGLALTESYKGDLKKWKRGPIAVFHGGQPDQEQYALIRDFNNAKGTIGLLIGTDAASEGLNLHHACHQMVHYDVPWSLITLEQRNGRIDRFGQNQTPVIRYLLTVPNSEDLAGDLRIIERLIEKESEASKTLGDVAWLLNKHSATAESQRIAEGIHKGEAPEEILVDSDQVADDFLMSLLSDSESEPEEHEEEVSTTEVFSLYSGDLAFAKESLLHLQQDQLNDLNNDPLEVEWMESLSGFRLQLPEDLRHRYQYLPPELVRDRSWEVKLTTDRKRVMAAYDQARDTEDGWPEWELWWGQHPIAQWMIDRVLASFRRHEAPLIEVHSGLAPGAHAYVFQSTLFNQRSQPICVDWSLVERDPSAIVPTLVRRDFQPLAPGFGLQTPISNTDAPLDASAASRDLTAAVAVVRDHMRAWKKDYESAVVKELRPRIKKLRRWRSTTNDALRDQFKLKGVNTRRIEARMREVGSTYEQRRAWIDDTIRCNAQPYIRLAAVLMRPLGDQS